MSKFDPKRHRLPIFSADGILLVDKPKEWTSFDVVNFVRSRFNVPKVGHCGTLDPAATGLLVLVLGRFTRMSAQLSGADKTYEATLRLGIETDSGDLDGAVIRESDYRAVTGERLRAIMAGFVGDRLQVPPMVSAVKLGGRKLYDLARAGVEVEREPKPITIHAIDITRTAIPDCDFTVCCSKGTYIRTLAEEIGREAGCGAVLAGLRRIRSGRFELADAVTVETLKTWEQADLEAYVERFLREKTALPEGVEPALKWRGQDDQSAGK